MSKSNHSSDESPFPAGHVVLVTLVRRLADRDAERTEETIQSDLHALLLAAPLELQDNDLEIVLEQQAGGKRRIDVEAGLCVFAVKRDLRRNGVRRDAELQLAGYVASRSEQMQQRYVGVLTDGAEWILYHLVDRDLQQVSQFIADGRKPAVDELCVWLEGVLATATIHPTPTEIVRRLGASSPSYALDIAEIERLYARFRDLPTVRLKRELWARLLTTALGTGFVDSDALFIEHTLLVAIAEVIAHAVIGIDPASSEIAAASLLTGELFIGSQVHGVVEADFFDWIVEVDGGTQFVKVLARRLSRFTWNNVRHDVLKVLYESIISATQRKQLGEYYTPDWLAEQIVAVTINNPIEQRVLDPSCGSGTFIFHAVRRFLDSATAQGIPNGEALAKLTQHVMGMDIHPVAVTFARVTYLLAIGTERLQADDRLPISIPIYLGDSIQWKEQEHYVGHRPRPENRVDVLIGNPPWLSYRFMTPAMQNEFRVLSEERGLWAGAKVATSQDLSALFILRAIERYLRQGGRFGFLMPWATLRGSYFAGFRRGRYETKELTLSVKFEPSWDLHQIKPAFFPVPAAVIFGQHCADGQSVALPAAVERWKGTLPRADLTWALAAPHIAKTGASIERSKQIRNVPSSPYAARFAQGTTLVPRLLLFVEVKTAGPLGAGAGRVSVQSKRSSNEKEPWKRLPSLECKVERQFVRSVHMGETILSYRPLTPVQCVIPWDGQRLLETQDEKLTMYPGLWDWWSKAETMWNAHRKNEQMSLVQRIDFQRGITQQFPMPTYRVVYTKSGMYLAAAIISEPAIIEQTLYWCAASSLEEARYLEAVINSEAMTQSLRPLQSRGEYNPRHYAKDVWRLPLPIFDPDNAVHVELGELAKRAEEIAKAVSLPKGKRFEALRRTVREAIAATDVGKEIERLVVAILANAERGGG